MKTLGKIITGIAFAGAMGFCAYKGVVEEPLIVNSYKNTEQQEIYVEPGKGWDSVAKTIRAKTPKLEEANVGYLYVRDLLLSLNKNQPLKAGNNKIIVPVYETSKK